MGRVIIYPDADAETTTVDGNASQAGILDWSVVQAGSGSASNDSSTLITVSINSHSTSNKWASIFRGFLLFDTDGQIPEGTRIYEATVTMKVYDKDFTSGWDISPTFNLFSSNPNSNTALVAGDYDSLGTTPLAVAHGINSINVYSPTSDGINVFTLNSDGLAAIDRNGITKFGIREATYDALNVEPTWQYPGTARMRIYSADMGAGYRPYLTIYYTSEHKTDKITLEAMRNLEMTTMGRFFIDEEGNAKYESRYARNG